MTEELTLYAMARNLSELVQLRETDGLTPEETAAIDQQIKEYIIAEVRKVDGVRAFLRQAEQHVNDAKGEILRVTQYQNVWTRRLDRVREMTIAVLQEFVEPDRKGKIKLEGRIGSLAIQGNGGVQPLVIDQPELVPDEYCRMVGWVTAEAWNDVVDYMRAGGFLERNGCWKLERVPNNDMIRAALESGCETCAGLGRIAVHTEEDLEPSLCGACGGDGKTKVPGARFAPRGERLVVK